MLSTLAVVVWSVAVAAAAEPAPARDPDAVLAQVEALRGAGKRWEGSKILWPASDEFPDHVPLQAAYEDEAVVDHYESTLARYQSRYEKDPTPENAYLFARIDYDRVRARNVVARALRTGSKLPGLLWLRTSHHAEDLDSAGKQEAALALIEAPQSEQVLDRLGAHKFRISILMNMGRLDEAEKALEAAREQTGVVDPGLHGLQAGVYLLQGALVAMNSLASSAPGTRPHAYALAMQAIYLQETGKESKARELWKKIVDSPRDFYGWDEIRMQALSDLGRGPEAAAQASAVLALDPANAAAHVHLAGYELRHERVENGEQLARNALARNPRSLSALGLLSSIDFEHGRYRDAMLLNDRALALAPGLAGIWVVRAAIQSHMKDVKGQRASMDRALKINSKNPYALREYGRMSLENGEWTEGLAAFKALIAQEEPAAEDFRLYGRASVGSDRLEQGMAGLERALELAGTDAEKRNIKKDIAWAQGYLNEASARYARDASARVEMVKVKTYLEDAPAAVYRESRRLVVGRPWGAHSARWTTEGAVSRRTLWAPGGTGVYALVDNRIDFLDLQSGATHTVVAEVPMQTAFCDDLPRSRYISSFALAPNGKHMYVLARETKHGKVQADVILDYTAEEKTPREVFRRNEIAFMQADPVSGRLLIAGGGNLRMDLAAGTTVEFPLVGCTVADMDYSPGGERMACVAVDAKGPEASEIILYDIATRKKVPLEIAGQGAAWSPDGQFLAYVWRGRQLRVLELKTAQVTAYDIGHQRDYLLPHAVEGGTDTRWSADGRFIHCKLGPAKGKSKRNWYGEPGEPTTVVVDRRDKIAWTNAGSFDEFEWAPAPKR